MSKIIYRKIRTAPGVKQYLDDEKTQVNPQFEANSAYFAQAVTLETLSLRDHRAAPGVQEGEGAGTRHVLRDHRQQGGRHQEPRRLQHQHPRHWPPPPLPPRGRDRGEHLQQGLPQEGEVRGRGNPHQGQDRQRRGDRRRRRDRW